MIAVKNNRKLFSVGLLFIVLGLVLIRENLFVEINAILGGYNYNKAYFYYFKDTFQNMELSHLYVLKWLLTVVFIILISLFTITFIRVCFSNKNYTKAVFLTYLVSYLIVVVVFIIFWLLGIYDKEFYVLRKLIGLLHSPIPLFFFFCLFYYLDSNKK